MQKMKEVRLSCRSKFFIEKKTGGNNKTEVDREKDGMTMQNMN